MLIRYTLKYALLIMKINATTRAIIKANTKIVFSVSTEIFLYNECTHFLHTTHS